LETQPFLQASSLVLGYLPPNWPSSLSFANPEAMDWGQLGCDPFILVPLQAFQVQPPLPRSDSVGVGCFPENRNSPVSFTNSLPESPGQVETSAFVLAYVEEESLLSCATVVLWQSLPSPRAQPIPSAYLEAMGWSSLDPGEGNMVSLQQEVLQPHPSWAYTLDLGQFQAHWCSQVQATHSLQKFPGPLATCEILLAFVEA